MEKKEKKMDFALTEENQMIKDMTRKFVDDNVIPYVEEWDRSGEYPYHVMAQMGELEIGRASCRERV